MTQITISGSIESLGDWALASSWQDKPLKKVIFNWSVPSFEEETFFGQNLTCYYPSNNPDWTADVLQNYGGTITWVGQEMEEPVVQKCGDNIFWEITENGTLVLTGTGAMYDYDVSAQQYAPWHEQRTAITAIEIGSGITHIGNNAFYDSPTVRSLSLPATLTSIGSYAFYKIGIQSLELQEGITEIGRGAFEESALRSVSLPDSLTYIPDNLFRFSYYLVTVDLPEMITYIGDEAFRSCAGLSSMVLPEGLKRIGRSAFACCGSRTIWGGVYPCTNFTEITLPDSLEEIADEAFNWCERLGNVTIPENVTRIGKYAFSRCGFTEITIPAGVQELGSYAFFLCSGLKTVRFQWTRPTIAGNAFSDVTATCYYPSNNPAWTADVLQNYSGKLTWIGQEMEEPGVSAPIEITVKNVGASTSGAVITAPEGGWKAGSNTFTVSCPAPCVVAVSSDGGLTYTRLTATALGDAYSFTAEDMTADTILAVSLFGDVDGNGKLTNLDAARCRSGYLRFLELDGLQQLIADVNKDGKLTNLDAARLRSIYLRYLTPEW